MLKPDLHLPPQAHLARPALGVHRARGSQPLPLGTDVQGLQLLGLGHRRGQPGQVCLAAGLGDLGRHPHALLGQRLQQLLAGELAGCLGQRRAVRRRGIVRLGPPRPALHAVQEVVDLLVGEGLARGEANGGVTRAGHQAATSGSSPRKRQPIEYRSVRLIP